MTGAEDLPRRGALNLTTPAQKEAFAHAEAAAREEVGEDVTVGEVVQELSSAYTGCYSWETEAEA